jgi:hypothetical protein
VFSNTFLLHQVSLVYPIDSTYVTCLNAPTLLLVLAVSIAALTIPIVFRVTFVVSTTARAISLIVPRSFRSLIVSFTSFAISRIAIVVSSIARASLQMRQF